MNYFRKTKFRETSLIFVAIFIAIIYFTISDSSEEDELDVQALIDAAVEEAIEEALATTSDEYTDKTEESTTTTLPPALMVPVDNYWGQYSDGTWAIVRLTEKPENFEWAWDVFNREDPSGAYGYDEFDENSTLIGTLVDFDCSFNRISKTEAHKEAFGVFETTIEYYDTYFDWAEDNYDYLTEEAVLTISKIMRGVWTCDYEYLESISTEYLDFVHSGDAYAEVPKLSEYIASFENSYDDEHQRGKYTYTLGALLYMTPTEYLSPVPLLGCEPPGIQWIGDKWYQWPMESMNPKQLNEVQIARMSMFDNGVTKSLIDGTYQGDDGTYGFRLQITTEGIWKAYKYTGHTWDSGYAETLPYYVCPEYTTIKKSLTSVQIGNEGYVNDVTLKDNGETEQFKFGECNGSGIVSTTQIYLNGLKVNKHDFKDGDYVHVIPSGEPFEGGKDICVADHEGGTAKVGTARIIYVSYRNYLEGAGRDSGFVSSVTLNESDKVLSFELRVNYINFNIYPTTQIYLNGIKVDEYNFDEEHSEYVVVEYSDLTFPQTTDPRIPAEATADAIYIVNK